MLSIENIKSLLQKDLEENVRKKEEDVSDLFVKSKVEEFALCVPSLVRGIFAHTIRMHFIQRLQTELNKIEVGGLATVNFYSLLDTLKESLDNKLCEYPNDEAVLGTVPTEGLMVMLEYIKNIQFQIKMGNS